MLFGLFAPETVDYIDLRSGIITFLSKKKRPLGGSAKVRLAIPQDGKHKNLDVSVSLVNVRTSHGVKGFICVGHLLVDEALYPQVEAALRTISVKPELGLAARRSVRYPISLRVMSRELPGFGAVTVDMSNHGARLACHGQVAEGAMVRLTLELDVGSMHSHLPVPAKCIWSRPDARGKGHIVGVEFCDMEPAAHDLLTRYMKSLADRMGGDVMHRTISDGEVFVRNNDNIAKP